MAKNTITLNEAQFRALVEECVNEVLLEEGVGDGFRNAWNRTKEFGQGVADRAKGVGNAVTRTAGNIAGAVKAGKQYYQGHKNIIDPGATNKDWMGNDRMFKTHHGATEYYDKNFVNTASEQAREAYNMYKQYDNEAKKYLGIYNSITAKYKLNKDGIGKRSSDKEEFNYNGGKEQRTMRDTKFARTANKMANKYGTNKNRNTLGLPQE